jgi:hypothetical protein
MRRPLFFAAVLLLAGCGGASPEPFKSVRTAEAQRAELAWLESYPSSGQRLLFEVQTLEVTAKGWSAKIAVTNSTRIPFELGQHRAELQYGLTLFATGDLGELEDAARAGKLPAPRLAERLVPSPPDVLAPGDTWRATISAPGSLPDGAYVRVSFGPLRAKGDAPKGMEATVLWITDRSYRL